MPPLDQAPRPRILVVEDDDLVLELIVTRLELAGYRTFYARDGLEGLARIKEVNPAGMVLDINMPKLDGFGVLERLKATGQIQHIPTMVLTARNQTDDVRRAVSLGARDFLAKPFKDEQLIARVGRLMRRTPPRAAVATAPVQAAAPTPRPDDKDDSLLL